MGIINYYVQLLLPYPSADQQGAPAPQSKTCWASLLFFQLISDQGRALPSVPTLPTLPQTAHPL